MAASDIAGQAQAQAGDSGADIEVGEPRRDEMAAEGKQMQNQKDTEDVDMENLFSNDDNDNDDDDDDDNDMESLFGSLDDNTENTSLASPTPTSFSAATPVSLPLPLCLPLPASTSASTSLSLPLPLPALPSSSSAAAVPADRNGFCDVSTTLPESDREEDGQRAQGNEHRAHQQYHHDQQEYQQEQQEQREEAEKEGARTAGAPTLPDPNPSGFDLNLNLGLDLGDIEFDFNLDLSNFSGNDTTSGAGFATGPLSVDAGGAEIDFDFRLDADEERQLAREMGLELEASQAGGAAAAAEGAAAAKGEAGTNTNTNTGSGADTGADIDTCFFDSTGLEGSTATTHNGDQDGQGRRMQDGQQFTLDSGLDMDMDMDMGMGMGLDFDFDLFPPSVLPADQAAAPGVPEATDSALAGSSASTPMVVDADTASASASASAPDDVVILYERPACARFVPMSASEHAETSQTAKPALPTQPVQPAQPKTAAQPALQLLSPASEPLSQPSSRHASEEASPAPTALSLTPTASIMPSTKSAPASAPTQPQPQTQTQTQTQIQTHTIPTSLQASIPHYLELRPRCPQIPPPKRIDLGEFNVEELLPYVQLHSKLSMVGIQQMLGLDIDAGRIVVGECRRYLADPAHKVAPSGTSDPAALRTLKVALIQSSLQLLKYGERGAHSPQSLDNGVGERWFSRSSSLEPRSMHMWPDDSTTLVLLFIQLLYRLTRNNSVRERQRKASALRKAQNLAKALESQSQSQSQLQTTPPHSPTFTDGTNGANGANGENATAAKTSSAPALQPRAKQPKRGARFPSHEASAAKHPRLSPPGEFPLPNANLLGETTTFAASTTTTGLPRALPRQLQTTHTQTHPHPQTQTQTQTRQPILAYNSPRVLRDDLILSASKKAPSTASIRYIVNVVDRGAQRLIPQLELGHDGPIRSAGYSHLAQRISMGVGVGVGGSKPSISIMTPLGLEKVGSDADWDRVVCRVHDDMIMDRQVRVLITLGG